VNIRTLRRYITMLQDLGAPIVAERGRNGAYGLEAGFKIPPMLFTNDEALALALGLHAAERLGPAETAQAVVSAQAKLERSMPPDLRERVQALAETMSLELHTSAALAPGAVMLAMGSAAQQRRQVQLCYQAESGERTERRFDPYGLAYRQGKWYAVGRCHLREDLRAFRLDRVADVELTDVVFVRPEPFDTLEYVVQTIATMPRRYRFEVLLHADLVAVQREIMAVLGLLEPCEGGVLLRGSTDDLAWLARQLAQCSFGFAVRAPEELRDALRARAAELVRIADARDTQ
jgi:predicted DNA-binding transcriptional regulator YafY